MNISFDWDGCLATNKTLKKWFKDSFMIPRLNFYIVTARTIDDVRNVDIDNFLADCQISEYREIARIVNFTSDKLKTIQELGINLHFDDDKLPVAQINEAYPGRAVLVNYQMEDFLFRP